MVAYSFVGVLLRQSACALSTRPLLCLQSSAHLKLASASISNQINSQSKGYPRATSSPPLITHNAYFHTSHHLTVECSTERRNKKGKENTEKGRKDDFKIMSNLEDLTHFHSREPEKSDDPKKTKAPLLGTDALPHPIWTDAEINDVEINHRPPENRVDKFALLCVRTLRSMFDLVSGYNRRTRTEKMWLTRIIFLETVAGVPGMVGAMSRHFMSLRRMKRDHGWIHTLLEEAENERMHLMTALQVKKPGVLIRGAVALCQGVFVPSFGLAYTVSPRFCHRFVGYLEEEAVITYTKCLKDIESGAIQHWKTQGAPDMAIAYWKLGPDATLKDVILAIRADEAHHRVVNHTFGSMKPDDYNPYKPGK